MQLDVKTLVEKLNPACRKALEGAARLCVQQTNFDVEAEHLLLCLLEQPDTDARVAISALGGEPDTLVEELRTAIEGFRRGNGRTPGLAAQLTELLEDAWVYSSRTLAQPATRSAGLLQAAYDLDHIREPLIEACPGFDAIDSEAMADAWPDILPRSKETMPSAEESRATDARLTKERRAERKIKPALTKADFESAEAAANKADGRKGVSTADVLEQFTISLTDQALVGAIDPIVGRDAEIRQMIDILMRRRQNNPILTGEAGVGKTAVVEGLAQRIADGDVPKALEDVDIRALDLGLLQAGASMKGEFEERLKSVVDAVAGSARPIILFIDEAHTLIGAGGAAGSGDAANLLKPPLARGELRTIAATTWGEYKKYIEKDAALARRFQVVRVAEPDTEAAVAMLRGLARRLEEYHSVRILDEALREAVSLSERYIAGRQLPDKAIGVLDTACARVATAQGAVPAAVEAAGRRAERLTDEIEILTRERVRDGDHAERITALTEAREAAEAERTRLEERWRAEREIVADMRDRLAKRLAGEPPGEAYAELQERLTELQGEEPLVPAEVDGDLVAHVVSGWTGIPLGRMMRDEAAGVLALEDRLRERIVGQDHALEAVARRIRTYRAGLDEPGKPTGVFLFAGPSGVGKTETALALAELLYGGEDHLISINLSEYQEAHTVSNLKGAPPGYVGYGEGGVLTEAVRRNPYSVVLLDEVEKAHPDVMELFYQVFDKGRMEDGEGVEVDFKNTVIILTSNLGDARITEAAFAGGVTVDGLIEAIRPDLRSRFAPAFLGRLTVVPYLPLGAEEIAAIIDMKLARVAARFETIHGAPLMLGSSVRDAIAARATEVESGARAIDNIVNQNLLPMLADATLARAAEGEMVGAATVTVAKTGGGFQVDFE